MSSSPVSWFFTFYLPNDNSLSAWFRKNEAKAWHENEKIKVKTATELHFFWKYTHCYQWPIWALDWVMAKDMKNGAGFFFSEPGLSYYPSIDLKQNLSKFPTHYIWNFVDVDFIWSRLKSTRVLKPEFWINHQCSRLTSNFHYGVCILCNLSFI